MTISEFWEEHQAEIVLLGFMVIVIIIGFAYLAAFGITPADLINPLGINLLDINAEENSSVILSMSKENL